MSKATMAARNTKVDARIKELENIICPAEQHDYALVNETPTFKEYGMIVYHRRYVCKRCLKVKEESDVI